MQKRFCDIEGCKKEAVKIKLEYQSKERITAAVGDSNTRIVFSIMFAFKNHPTGFGGPPDLCREHALDMIRDILQQESK